MVVRHNLRFAAPSQQLLLLRLEALHPPIVQPSEIGDYFCRFCCYRRFTQRLWRIFRSEPW